MKDIGEAVHLMFAEGAGLCKTELLEALETPRFAGRIATRDRIAVAEVSLLVLAEASAFREHQVNGLAYILQNGYLPPAKAWLWKNAIALSGQGNELPFTEHYNQSCAPTETALAA